jgi:hypothetical protein
MRGRRRADVADIGAGAERISIPSNHRADCARHSGNVDETSADRGLLTPLRSNFVALTRFFVATFTLKS